MRRVKMTSLGFCGITIIWGPERVSAVHVSEGRKAHSRVVVSGELARQCPGDLADESRNDRTDLEVRKLLPDAPVSASTEWQV